MDQGAGHAPHPRRDLRRDPPRRARVRAPRTRRAGRRARGPCARGGRRRQRQGLGAAGPRPPARARGVRHPGAHGRAHDPARAGPRRMTAQAATEPRERRTLGELLESIPLRPSEGWVSLFSTAAMAVVVALSFVDAAWTPGRPGDSAFMPWLAVAGVGFGIAGAKIGWGRWRTHAVGALF